jgi:hypothetical protein
MYVKHVCIVKVFDPVTHAMHERGEERPWLTASSAVWSKKKGLVLMKKGVACVFLFVVVWDWMHLR